MHRALHIDEVLRVVILDLEARDLLHVALTCKVFLEPALDNLWHTLFNPHLLFHLWPLEALQVGPHTEPEHYPDTAPLNLLRPLLSAEWERFNFYAQRVRELEIGLEAPIPPQTVHNLHLSLSTRNDQSERLLPKLTSLRLAFYGSFDPQAFAIPTLLLSPTLTNLAVYAGPNADHIGFLNFLQALVREIRPCLKTLLLEDIPDGFLDGETDGGRFMEFVAPSLKEITLSDGVTWDTIEALAKMPRLEMFEYGGPRGVRDDGEEGFGVVASDWFPVLQGLKTRAGLALHLLSGMEHRHSIKEVEVFFYPNLDKLLGTMQPLINLLGSSSFPDIQHFSFIGRNNLQLFDGPFPLSFLPLKSRTDMRTFRISPNLIPLTPPTDEEYTILARAWPKLRIIEFKSFPPARATKVTLDVLSRSCPKLEEIAIDIDPTLSESSTFGILPNLKSLSLWRSGHGQGGRSNNLLRRLQGREVEE